MAAERARAGDWVGIHAVVLAAGERAPNVPADTGEVPLELRVNGLLIDASAAVGDEVGIRTLAGRTLRGHLEFRRPAYEHGFGAPLVELLDAGAEARALLARRGEEGS